MNDGFINRKKRETADRRVFQIPLLGRTILNVSLLAFAVPGFLLLGAGNAEAACTAVAPIVTCNGDVSGGASFGAPAGTLNVNSLTVDAGSISLNRSSGDAGDGTSFPVLGGDGDDADSGSGATVNYVGGTNSIVVGGIGIAVRSNGGNGGSGGDGTGFPIFIFPFFVPGIGGDGGDGGNGGTVFVTSNGSITTTGAFHHGIFAEANAGNGGNGGDGDGIIGVLGFGGDGGRGGTGGSVTVQSNGAITTNGATSHGILASSRGGVGGSGGDADGVVAAGGSGAGTGPGGSVSVTSTNSIVTAGSASYGIFAQSVGGFAGGGGGGGGLIAFGGSGESAGNGGTVTVTNSGTISTALDESVAIFAQSVGGGGGDGGGSGGIISVGGTGAGGGSGSTVKVNNSGALSTGGGDASAIFAQSVGGGGGNGGTAVAVGPGLAVAIGGSAGAGGSAGTVIVNETVDANTLTAATIQTAGGGSSGIFAQSVGGGGGNGGLAVAVSPGVGTSVSVALGGSGGPGGAGRAVTVNEKGDITTGGANAHGIFAQSVGGGGGNGGGSVAVAANAGGYSLGFAMGGTAGAGGNASTVTVNAVGNIATTGSLSHGVFAQSVGGGGGNGGFSVAATGGSLSGSLALGGSGGVGGVGGNVTVNVSGAGFVNPTVSTTTDGSHGIFAQSVGGGGGNGGFAGTLGIGGGAASVSLGGSGAAGARGGTVNVTNSNAITTGGNDANGILAQSVGGGGGTGGFALSASGGVISVAAAIGGGGGAGSNGESVDVDNSGNITTIGSLAHGIFAQSVGGGGGNGGFAISGALGVSVKNIPGGAAAISIGGRGGGASNGGTVTVNNSGSIEAGGLGSHAIFAQSVGGGGGKGGFAGSVAMTLGDGAAFGISVGGTGGGGGNAGAVDVTSTGATIITHKEGADGIHAQSVGGGGGDGGFAAAGAFGFGGEVNVNVAVAIGGFGSAGGIGSTVVVDNQTAITTSGSNASGIFAQSVGGGGGDGGLAVSGTLGLSETAGNVGVTVGGFAGDGSTANKVAITNAGAITTTGLDAIGILGESIGGSGGNGGLALTAQLTGATKTSATVGVSIGGGGGTGNSAGMVEITNNAGGEINTTGFGAHAIKAQSIGGGGGNGGLAIVAQLGVANGSEAQATKTLNVGVAVGGAGGDGGFGNTVQVTNHDSIEVMGDTATGIFAHSIGGGGGDGGGAINAIGMLTVNTANKDSRSVVVTVSVGGGGGDGNHGSDVVVDNSGSITTHGVSGYGVYAQSVGGGGGIGGRANSIALPVTNTCTVPVACTEPASLKNNFQLGVSVGGSGGGTSNGGMVTVNNTGAIETFGNTSDGIFAQSTGGGGGAGGNGIFGSGELLPVPAELVLIGNDSVSFFKNLQVVVGGDAGSSGNGGMVEVNNNKNITTHGSNSSGIFAQSVGGGGGVGGKAVIGATGKIGLGGAGGASGDGGNVTVNQVGGATIETFGSASNGIFAQSVGGGGGVAGNVDRAVAADIEVPILGFTIPKLNVGVGLAFGQSGGGGGDGGIVDVVVDGQIITHGDSAAGVFAQSVGGGGGVLGELGNDVPVLSLLSWQIGSAGDAGNAGLVDVNLTGSIVTAGNNATGIFAQSAGGTGTAGAVNVTLDGSILTGEVLQAGDENRGLGSIGILAQSVADDNANNNDITVNISTGGVVRGGRSQPIDIDREYFGVGIWVIDGKDNTITNNGLVTTLGGALEGYAILGTGSDFFGLAGGNETVSNFGTVTGSVVLGRGTNSFTNEVSGTYNSGRFANVGSGNFITNNGWMFPGGVGSVLTTSLDGNWTQTATATYGVDLDLALTGMPGEADLIDASEAIDVGGLVDLTLLNTGNALPGQHQVTIASSATTLTDAGVALQSPASAVATYALDTTASELNLSYAIDFSPHGLNRNQTSIGEYINQVQLAGGSVSLEPYITALFNIPDVGAYGGVLDQLSPEPYLGNEIADMFATLQFENALMSCPVYSGYSGVSRFDAEGECAWLKAGAQHSERDRDQSNFDYQLTSVGLAGGVQVALSDRIHAGLGLSWDHLDSSSGDQVDGTGYRLQVGGVLKANLGDTTIAAAVTGGMSKHEVTRRIDLPMGPSDHAKGDEKLTFVSGHVRVGHTFEQTNWYVQPRVDVGVAHFMLKGFDEDGNSPVGLEVESKNETYVTIQPGIELGGEIQGFKDDVLLRPYARLGLLYVANGTAPEISATFAGAPDSVSPFTVVGDVDNLFADIGVGVDLVSTDGVSVGLYGDAKLAEKSRTFGGHLKIVIPF